MERSDLFQMHSANFRAVGDGFEQAALATRNAIRVNDSETERAMTRLCALLLGMLLEGRLNRIISEQGGFDDVEYEFVDRQRSQKDRWQSALEVGFRRRHNRWDLSSGSIGNEARRRLDQLSSAFVDHLEPIIGMRNKLAHGQWEHPLNSSHSAIHTAMKCQIDSESILTLSIKERLALHYEHMILDLVSTSSAFERDFDVNYGNFMSTLNELARADSLKYRQDLRDKFLRGHSYRSAARNDA